MVLPKRLINMSFNMCCYYCNFLYQWIKQMSWHLLHYFAIVCIYIHFHVHRKVVIYGTLFWKDVIYGRHQGIYGIYSVIYGNYFERSSFMDVIRAFMEYIYGYAHMCRVWWWFSKEVAIILYESHSIRGVKIMSSWCAIVPIKFWQGV
jgi:hypothetical protein